MTGPRRAALLAVCLLAGCTKNKPGVVHLRVQIDLAHDAADKMITVLRTTVAEMNEAGAGRQKTLDYRRPGGGAIQFPATMGIELSRDVAGPVRIEVLGLDQSELLVAQAVIDSQTIAAAQPQDVRLFLSCARDCATPDGGAPDAAAPDAPAAEVPPSCGNGRLDPGETCDVAIAMGKPGACPPASCDDSIPCTADHRTGDGCTAQCQSDEIRTFSATDGCCPAGGTHSTDPDCSATCGDGAIQPGETCDTAIQAGQPGACPTGTSCLDTDACTRDLLISAGTCSARCVHQPITAFVPNDGCCPAGATHTTDPDCPEVCGNGIVEPSETCDMAIPQGQPGACPVPCTEHGPCIREFTEGSGCRAVCRTVTITDFIIDDGCCPRGGNGTLDPDCKPVCGNGVVEPGEQCDRAIPAGQQGACPTSCSAEVRGCMPPVLKGSAIDCTARCMPQAISACSPIPDGCCPAGCTTKDDPDCSPTCGNGLVEQGETCDTAIAQPMTGACPKQCDDSNNCTADSLISRDTCNARCQFTPITTFGPMDGCCPLGGNHNVDPDCPFVCGNGVVEGPKESCDPGIPAPAIGSCPTACPPPSACKQYTLAGDPGLCTARCDAQTITACQSGDECCPAGCNQANDSDCPAVCGNAVLETGEACDKAITAGKPGACAQSCDDGNPCTDDATSGRVEDCTRSCSHAPITACAVGDHCCPAGCKGDTDSDCVPVCGNGLVESGESCDLPSTCPASCPDDGDVCTTESLIGSPMDCNVRCLHTPITACSGASADHCCPTGCQPRPDAALYDIDCPP